MPAQAGRDLLIKIDLDGSGQFQTVAGLRATRLQLDAEGVDATSLDSPGRWRELLGRAGVRRAAVTGSGVFKDEATSARVRALFFEGDLAPTRVVVPGLGTITGAFHVASIDYRGTHDGEATFELSLASAGPLAWAPL